MLHMIKKKGTIILFCIAVMLSLSACKQTEIEDVSVIEQDAEIEESIAEEEPEEEEPEVQEEEIEEEPEKEEVVAYVEEHDLKFCDDTSIKTKGLALNSFDHSDYIETDVDFEWEIVSIEDAEKEGFKTITILETITGYRWFDGREKKTDVIFPTVNVVDTYTGLIIPGEMTHYDMKTEISGENIEWNGETYNISYLEDTEWDYENEWKPLNDYYAGWCTLYDTLTITIPENYDGLALFLPSIFPLIESIGSDEHIMDYWTDDGCYLFKVDVNAEVEDEVTNVSEKTTTDKVDTAVKTEETKTQEVKQEETKVETTKQDSVKPAHSHSYTETVTANPTCSNAGSKTFTCSCGDNYTESIPANGQHNWVAQTEVIHHESKGHMESTPIEVNTFHCRGCAGVWTDLDEFRYHSCDGSASASTGFYYTTETTYDNTWVVDEEAWDETVTTYTCSTCGARQ